MVLTNNKDLRIILIEAESNGWVFTKRKNHIKGKHPSGKTTTMGTTPSDRRALENIKSHLRTGEEACA